MVGAGWLCVLRGLLCAWLWILRGGRCPATLRYDAILHFRSILIALLQAPGFSDVETFTDKTFTGVTQSENHFNIEIEEMEVFAVSGYP